MAQDLKGPVSSRVKPYLVAAATVAAGIAVVAHPFLGLLGLGAAATTASFVSEGGAVGVYKKVKSAVVDAFTTVGKDVKNVFTSLFKGLDKALEQTSAKPAAKTEASADALKGQSSKPGFTTAVTPPAVEPVAAPANKPKVAAPKPVAR